MNSYDYGCCFTVAVDLRLSVEKTGPESNGRGEMPRWWMLHEWVEWDGGGVGFLRFCQTAWRLPVEKSLNHLILKLVVRERLWGCSRLRGLSAVICFGVFVFPAVAYI